MDQSNIKLTIQFCDPDAEEEELDQDVRLLLNELREMEEVDSVERVADPNPPTGNKSSGNFLFDLLTLGVSPVNCLKVIKFVGERFGNKPLKLKVKTPKGKEVELEASSQEEFLFLKQQAQEFLTDQ